MIKVYKKGSTGLEEQCLTLLDNTQIESLKIVDKLNGHNDIEFNYPIKTSSVSGTVVVNKSLLCGTFVCGETRTNNNSNESQYLEKEVILNVDNSLFIIYDAPVSGNLLKIKGSDYMNVDVLQKMLSDNMANINAIKNETVSIKESVSNDKNTISTSIANAKTEMNTSIANAKTQLNNQINANKADYNATMVKIKTDNETYIKNNGVTAVFA